MSSGAFHNASDGGFQEGFYAHPSEITDLFAGHGIRQMSLISIRGIAYGQEQQLLEIQKTNPALHRRLLDLIKETQSDPVLVATAGHALFIGRKFTCQ